MAEDKADYSFRILNEEASVRDDFAHKTHERIAKSISQIMTSGNSGQTIGLEGPWGCGKSTVVKLLKNMLRDADDNKFEYIYFDAWAHEGDPLRRVFLESLIEQVEDKNKNLWVFRKICGLN